MLRVFGCLGWQQLADDFNRLWHGSWTGGQTMQLDSWCVLGFPAGLTNSKLSLLLATRLPTA
jgi:hypothetical protein